MSDVMFFILVYAVTGFFVFACVKVGGDSDDH